MGSVEVAVAVFYLAVLDTLIEQRLIRFSEVVGLSLDFIVFVGRDGNINILLGLSEVLIGVYFNRPRFPVGADLRAGYGLIVKCHQLLSYPGYHLLRHQALR